MKRLTFKQFLESHDADVEAWSLGTAAHKWLKANPHVLAQVAPLADDGDAETAQGIIMQHQKDPDMVHAIMNQLFPDYADRGM